MKKILSILILCCIIFSITSISNVEAVSETSITTSSIEGNVGETVEIECNLVNPNGLTGIQFDLEFDKDIVEFINLEDTKLVDGIFVENTNDAANGKIRIAWMMANASHANGIIVKIEFLLKNKGTTNITIKDTNFKDNDVQTVVPSINNGSITVNVDEETAVNFINSAENVSDTKNALETYADELGLTLSDYDILSEQSKIAVAQAIFDGKGAGYANADAIVTAFNNAVSAQKSEEELAAAVDTINDVLNENEMKTSLEDNASTLGLNLSVYNTLLNKLAVASTMFDGKPYADAAAIVTSFNNAVSSQKAIEDAEAAAIVAAIAEVNRATEETMATVLVDNNSILELNLNGDYAALNDQSPVHSALVGQNFENIADIANAFDSAVALQKQVEFDIATAIEAVNNAIEDTMANVLVANNNILGLNLNGDYAILNNQSPVHAALVGQEFEQISQIVSAFDSAVAAQRAVEDAEAALAAATQAVAEAEAATEYLSTQVLIDAAQTAHDNANTLVTVLVDSEEKTGLITRLALVQTTINNAQALLNAVIAAETAIADLPDTIDTDNPAHKTAVDNARALVEAAVGLGAAYEDINGYADLVAAEALFEHGYLSGTIKIPFNNYNEQDVTMKINGVGASVKLDFTDGSATIPDSYPDGEYISISTIADQETLELTIVIDGFTHTIVVTGPVVDGDNVDIGTVNLVPGDVNGDGQINIQDVAKFAQRFNEDITDRKFDLNGDGKVNVKDLFYIGENYQD